MQSFLLAYDAFHTAQIKINIMEKMLNKKFSQLFMRKESNKKEDQKQPVLFDENFFHCRLISTGINTELIRIQTQVKENGQPLDQIKCKWFIKNTHDFKEIQEVTSEYYQPCLDDVGSVICVQIEPFIEGKKYNGIIIMKQSQIIHIDCKLQDELNKFLQRKQMKFDGRLEAVFSQDEKYESFQMPTQIKLEIIEDEIHVHQNGKQFQLIKINSEYPNVQFIRKSFNSVILNFNDRESYKLSFNNNFQRDLFALITRTMSAHCTHSINPEKSNQTEEQVQSQKKEISDQIIMNTKDIAIQEKQKSQEGLQIKQEAVHACSEEVKSEQVIKSTDKIENSSLKQINLQVKSSQRLELCQTSSSKQKIQEPKQNNNTLLILKLDEQGKELKTLKRQLDELRVNYNIEKQSKKYVETSNEQLKQVISQLKKKLEESISTNKKMAQVHEDNRFYKNEIAIVKKQLKASKQKVKNLQAQIQSKNTQEYKEFQLRINNLICENNELKQMSNSLIKVKQNSQAQYERIKQDFQSLQNQNHLLKKKLESLQSERYLPQPVQPEQQKGKTLSESEQKVIELEMKLKNLEMLLKYKSSQGDPSSNFQLLVNKLTQTISQKQIQINEFKKINKSLLQQLKVLKQKAQ